MIRISTIFVAICMVLVAASLGLILYSVAGVSGSESALVALTALTFLILYNAVAMRLRDRSDTGNQIADLSRGTADLARQVAEFGRRLAAIEGRMVASNSAGSDRLQSVIGEINELGGLVKQLATAVAHHEDLLVAPNPTPHRSVSPQSSIIQGSAANSSVPDSVTGPLSLGSDHEHASFGIKPQTETAAATTPDIRPAEFRVQANRAPDVRAPEVKLPELKISDSGAPEVRSPSLALAGTAPAAQRGPSQLLTSVVNAIQENRLDIYLQPLVTLPQRKVRFYEAVTRLRDERDQIIAPEDFVGVAEANGLMGQIDTLVMHRCIQVLRRLLVRNKDIGVFCNIAAATLGNPAIFGQCLDYLEANRALAPSFVLEFKQSVLRNLGPVEMENLAALAQRGYRFSIDHVTDLRFEPRDLADRGVRYIKIPAALLLDPKQTSSSDIHPSDLSDLLGRFGIDLIAERIEGERTVVDLLDYDVRFGQGFLFAPPRPLRPEGASATGGAPALPNAGPGHKTQDSHSAGKTTSEASSSNLSARAVGSSALARRASGTV